jgi:hypothetical protein
MSDGNDWYNLFDCARVLCVSIITFFNVSAHVHMQDYFWWSTHVSSWRKSSYVHAFLPHYLWVLYCKNWCIRRNKCPKIHISLCPKLAHSICKRIFFLTNFWSRPLCCTFWLFGVWCAVWLMCAWWVVSLRRKRDNLGSRRSIVELYICVCCRQ